ncbi:septum formation initiator family protein [Acinetobacter rudis]|uniref:Cell division protein FtsB n=1 Tax=Acinetobacter rudis TaxID=632955 RepID=A0AAW8J8Z0_9GAMM|nr:septum formation initiator family protein [Acinetobacter rudis]MDQ8935968.1 septum formation initiator family protein [Acinetobacter rudis]MDQ8953814.1 septum formation initiator family protein [Acinetobacter rudis]MDQ9018231.1 septum formation initiator family protein [Acinetobacter rudis]
MLDVFKTTASKLLLVLAIILIAVLQYSYWYGEGGYFPRQNLLEKIQVQLVENEELKERNRILAAEVYDLKNGAEAIEEHARLDLGLIKPHETFVQMSTVGTNYQPIALDPSLSQDSENNEQNDDTPPEVH